MLQANTPPTARAPLGEWVETALLIANLGWTTTCRGGVRADTLIITTLLTAALVIAHAGRRAFASPATVAPAEASAREDAHAARRSNLAAIHPASWWLLPFLAYAAANVGLITPVRWLGWLDWLEWAQMVAVFWVVLNDLRSTWPRRVVFFTLALLAIGGVVLACYQRFLHSDWVMFGDSQPIALHGRASGSFGIPNSFAGFLVLLLPPVLGLVFRRHGTPTQRVWWGWVGLILLGGLILAISRGAWLSLAVALTLWPLFSGRDNWWRGARRALVIVAALGVLGTILYWQSPKIRTRFTALIVQGGEITRPHMWRGAWQLFRDAPITGTGAGSYNILFERHRVEGFRDEPLWAHNEYLNTLSDYGLVGFLLFFGPAVWIAFRCCAGRTDESVRRRDWVDARTFVSGCGIGLFAFALQMALDFHLKIPALALTAATLAGLAVSRAWPVRAGVATTTAAQPRTAAICTAALLVAGTVGLVMFLLPQLQAESHRQEARRILDRFGATAAAPSGYASRLSQARAALAAATELNRGNAQAWSDRAYATALWAYVEPARTGDLGREAEAAANTALAITPVSAEFWVRRGVARDMQGRWNDASQDFTKAVQIAPNDSMTWYYYADHMSRLKWADDLTNAALRFCLRLDPGNPAGVALRQRLAINQKAH